MRDYSIQANYPLELMEIVPRDTWHGAKPNPWHLDHQA